MKKVYPGESFAMNQGDEVALCIPKEDYDFEKESTPPEKGGETLCGRIGRKHRMKRQGPMSTTCIYDGCDACC